MPHSILAPNEKLEINDKLTSPNGQYELILQTDGNLVLYHLANQHAIWATGTNGKDVRFAIHQSDGNFVLYLGDGKPVWASNTNGKSGSYLQLQDDANLVVYTSGPPVWASNTVNRV